MSQPTQTAVYAILESEGKVYLMQRADTKYCPGAYGLPSGHLEHNEMLADALIREVQEETGLTITPAHITLAHNLFYLSPINSTPYNAYFYKVTDYKGQPTITEPHKCSHADWFAWDNLPKEMPPEVAQALSQIR